MRVILLRVCKFTLLGAACNVLVAWTLFVWRPGTIEQTSLDIDMSNEIWERFDAPQSSGGRQPWRERMRYNQFFYVANANDFLGKRHREIAECAAGWPAKSLVGQLWEDEKAVWLFNLPRMSFLRVDEARNISSPMNVLPVFPLARGFLLNTSIYAGLIWLTFAVPRSIRARSRVRRGLCAVCGYDRRGCSEACPECGTAKPSVDKTRH